MEAVVDRRLNASFARHEVDSPGGESQGNLETIGEDFCVDLVGENPEST